MSIVVGLTGAKGVGKTTYANYLKKRLEEFGKEVIILSFATLIKDIFHDIDDEYHITQLRGKEHMRRHYQKCGDLMRSADKDIFVKYTNKICVSDENDDKIIIIDDVRYENEAGITDIMVRLERDEVDYTMEHSSEEPLCSDLIDFSLSLKPLYTTVPDNEIALVEAILDEYATYNTFDEVIGYTYDELSSVLGVISGSLVDRDNGTKKLYNVVGENHVD